MKTKAKDTNKPDKVCIHITDPHLRGLILSVLTQIMRLIKTNNIMIRFFLKGRTSKEERKNLMSVFNKIRQSVLNPGEVLKPVKGSQKVKGATISLETNDRFRGKHFMFVQSYDVGSEIEHAQLYMDGELIHQFTEVTTDERFENQLKGILRQ